MKRSYKLLALGAASCLALGIALTMLPRTSVAQKPPAPTSPDATANATAKPDVSADEKAIRDTADVFVKAFDAGDAPAIAKLWSADAEYTDESGQTFHGSAQIEKLYADMFKEHPGATIEVKIESIRLLGPDIAVEKGISRAASPKGEKSAARYTVVHARRDGKWIMVDCRDSAYVAGSNEDFLKDLGWLVGQWTTTTLQGMHGQITFEWMCNKNFLQSHFALTDGDKTTEGGGQIIGWNPRIGKIVALHYGASGGFGNEVWIKDGSKWVIEATGVLRDGSESKAVNIITRIDDNSFTWQSVSRTLDGVKLPDIPPVKIVRVVAPK